MVNAHFKLAFKTYYPIGMLPDVFCEGVIQNGEKQVEVRMKTSGKVYRHDNIISRRSEKHFYTGPIFT